MAASLSRNHPYTVQQTYNWCNLWYLFSEDLCAKCSDQAVCDGAGKCTCKEGFKGDGETCKGDKEFHIIARI